MSNVNPESRQAIEDYLDARPQLRSPEARMSLFGDDLPHHIACFIDSTVAKLADEKRRRVYYQDIVYAVSLLLDNPQAPYIVAGTADSKATGVQDAVKAVLRQLAAAQAYVRRDIDCEEQDCCVACVDCPNFNTYNKAKEALGLTTVEEDSDERTPGD